ncbi:hypothetical protein [Actinoplanes sp. NPDC051851]|uniref:hypothetical protein n=1 Tax=Actinoplanes sp. NPDC051851 TaxID=3154753 RepID=UPI0034276388
MRIRPRNLTIAATLALSLALTTPGTASAAAATAGGKVTIGSGETWVVSQTTKLSALTLAEGGTISAPAGYSLTLTVNGVETGQKLTATGGTDAAIVAGTYRGDVVVTVTEQNAITYQGLTFPFRQALYVDATGVVKAKSVSAAINGSATITGSSARNLKIQSTGEVFNGVYVNDADYDLVDPTISLKGNGRSDFVGYGSAITATGDDTTLVVDGARIDNKGVVRTAVVADGGSNVIVKNSKIHTADGTLPSDYVSTVNLPYMEDMPWMLGATGTVRATNLLGANTQASYINSQVSSESWGVLSTDGGSDMKLTSINSDLAITGKGGYGSYVIGNATEEFLGTTMNVATYAAINRGGSVHYGDSSRAAVKSLNSSLSLGLTAKELQSLAQRRTVINSKKFGVMWHGAGTVDIDGGTVLNTAQAAFLNKGQAVGITVDGSQGASVNAKNGVILQVIEDDDPGPVMVNGQLVNAGVYTEPTGEPAKSSTFDLTAAHSSDTVATFSDISLKGDFYNAIRGSASSGKNLILTLDGTKLTGVVTSSESHHAVSTITSADYEQLGVVTNTAEAAVNNGVVVDLSGCSTWTVTGTSYLTKLTIGAKASIAAPKGKKLTATVDGVTTTLKAGATYTGAIVLRVK